MLWRDYSAPRIVTLICREPKAPTATDRLPAGSLARLRHSFETLGPLSPATSGRIDRLDTSVLPLQQPYASAKVTGRRTKKPHHLTGSELITGRSGGFFQGMV